MVMQCIGSFVELRIWGSNDMAEFGDAELLLVIVAEQTNRNITTFRSLTRGPYLVRWNLGLNKSEGHTQESPVPN